MSGYPFLRAQARDINAELRPNDAGWLAKNNIPNTSKPPPENSESFPPNREPQNCDRFPEEETQHRDNNNIDRDDERRQLNGGHHNQKPVPRDRQEEPGDGSILVRLKPLLDSFIREDPHRTGTLLAGDFRRVLCEGHGEGLWPSLAAPPRGDRRREGMMLSGCGGRVRGGGVPMDSPGAMRFFCFRSRRMHLLRWYTYFRCVVEGNAMKWSIDAPHTGNNTSKYQICPPSPHPSYGARGR